MCGRYICTADLGTIFVRFGIRDEAIPYKPRYNVAPTQQVLAVLDQGSGLHGEMLRWGLVPFWAKDIKAGYRMINARADTLATSGAFKHAFKSRRCLVVADGFYEWKKEGKTKTPMRIGLKPWEPFAFAGLWESWTDKERGEEVRSCTIITCPPNELMAPIHDRMPVILPRQAEALWLDGSARDPSDLQALLAPYPAEMMEAYPVSDLVNSVKHDSPELIEPRLATPL
jgi:putative SOS response-associated peptidase YedK